VSVRGPVTAWEDGKLLTLTEPDTGCVAGKLLTATVPIASTGMRPDTSAGLLVARVASDALPASCFASVAAPEGKGRAAADTGKGLVSLASMEAREVLPAACSEAVASPGIVAAEIPDRKHLVDDAASLRSTIEYSEAPEGFSTITSLLGPFGDDSALMSATRT
jgi:hypothetical protein